MRGVQAACTVENPRHNRVAIQNGCLAALVDDLAVGWQWKALGALGSSKEKKALVLSEPVHGNLVCAFEAPQRALASTLPGHLQRLRTNPWKFPDQRDPNCHAQMMTNSDDAVPAAIECD
jgi:hypothetical protein